MRRNASGETDIGKKNVKSQRTSMKKSIRVPEPSPSPDMTLRVLGYWEEGAWVAHCLETDLVGHGDDFEAALGDLLELTEMQVSFAVQNNCPWLLDRPAPPDIWQAFERVAQERLRNLQRPPTRPTMTTGSLPLPSKSAGTGPLDFTQARGCHNGGTPGSWAARTSAHSGWTVIEKQALVFIESPFFLEIYVDNQETRSPAGTKPTTATDS